VSGKCKSCGSYAINPHRYDREPGIDVDLCDVHYWQKRAVRDDAGRVERVKAAVKKWFLTQGFIQLSASDVSCAGIAHDAIAAADGDKGGT
jgi:hypothetical protein